MDDIKYGEILKEINMILNGADIDEKVDLYHVINPILKNEKYISKLVDFAIKNKYPKLLASILSMTTHSAYISTISLNYGEFYYYIIFSGNLELFKKIYDYPRANKALLRALKKIGHNKETEPFFNYLDNIYQSIYNDNHKKVCYNNEIIPIEKTIKQITIPIIPIIDRKKPIDTPLDEYNIAPITVEFEFFHNNFGESYGSLFDYKGLKLDKTFLSRNQKFLSSLTMRERIILSGYTFQGDRFTNLYLRKDPSLDTYISEWVPDNNKFLNPLYYQLLDNIEEFKKDKEYKGYNFHSELNEWIKKNKKNKEFVPLIQRCIKQYTEELLGIFSKAPVLKEETVVFRGSKTYYYKKSNSDIYTNVEFMSTTLSPISALEFIEGDCCFNIIHLTPETKVIFMEPVTQTEGEMEIIISPNTNFKIISNKMQRGLRDNDISDYQTRVCYPMISYMRYTVLKTV